MNAHLVQVDGGELRALRGQVAQLRQQLELERRLRGDADRACGQWRRIALERGARLDALERARRRSG